MPEPMRHPLPHLVRIDWPGLAAAVCEQRGSRRLPEIAPEVGISAATIGRAEIGRPVSVHSFACLCAWLDVPITQFIGTVIDG